MIRMLILLFFLGLNYTLPGQLVSIYDIQGQASISPYNNKQVLTRGAVTGVFSDGYFIRENENEWGAIYIYDPGRIPVPSIGDTVEIGGMVTEYYEWTEIKSLTSFEILSEGNPIPEFVTLKTADIDEAWESCLVRIEDLTCTNTNLGYGEWEVQDETGKIVIDDMGVSFSPVLGQKYSITGLLIYSYGAFKLEPRTIEDIVVSSPVYFTKMPEVSLIRTTAITLQWETNVESSSEAYWGYTPAMEQGHLKKSESSLFHNLTIDGLSPSEFIYVQEFSVRGEDTAINALKVYVTASESSGEIIVSFNKTNTGANSSDQSGLFTSNLADSIITYIGKANSSLDIAFYDFTNHASSGSDYKSGIGDAIFSAISRGVKVRLITDADVAAAVPYQPGFTLNTLKVEHDGIMHHKFMIIDHESVQNSWVVTGSTNPNFNNLEIDFNNLVAIQDQSLSMAYLKEFNEIWGGNAQTPDLLQSRSGSLKVDNTPHVLSIDGKRIELYFSPSDYTTLAIKNRIDTAKSSIDFAVMAFTENVLGSAIADAYLRGITIQGIIDYVEYSGSEFDYLTDRGIDIYDYQNPDGTGWPDSPTMHHKFAIIDHGTDSAHVITGSHNWTASAESRNDENTLIIFDREVADMFRLEMDRIVNWLKNPNNTSIQPTKYHQTVYPNPTRGMIYLKNAEISSIQFIRITDISGNLMKEVFIHSEENGGIDVTALPLGVYFLEILDKANHHTVHKIIKF